MPVYTNTGGATAHFPGYGNIAAGISVIQNNYAYPIPTGFALTSYNNTQGAKEAPWVTLHNAVLGAGVTLTGLEAYNRIQIYNGSGADISVVANEATSHALTMASGSTQAYSQPKDRKDLSRLVITGVGVTAINVTAWRD